MYQILFVAFIALAATASGANGKLRTVKELDVKAYLGKWFQVYSNFLVQSTIERNGTCITAQYGAGANSTITVLNSERKGSPTGPPNSIKGVASRTSPCQPGQLSLKLDNVPFTGSYWVLALGPVVGGLYQWSVVSDKSGATLFILARDPATFKKQYEKSVLRIAEKLGFTGFKKPIASYQGKDCIY